MAHRLFGIILLLGLLVAACGDDDTEARSLDGTAATIFGGECVEPTGKSVTIYSGRSENLMQPVYDAFECETGIDLEHKPGDANELALLMAEEGDKTKADVFLSNSPGPVGFLEAEGLLGTISQPVLELVDAQNRSSNGTWVGFSGRKRVLVYNTDDVAEADLPMSVFDLTDPVYRDQVAIPATNGSFADWFTVFRQEYGNDVAGQWLDDMVANGASYYENNRAIVEAVGRGEIQMGLVNHYYNIQEKAAQGDSHRAENHDLGDEDIGSLLIVTAAAVTANTDDVESAEALVAYLLSQGVQQYYSTETFEYPLAAGVAPADVLPPLSALSVDGIDFDDLGGGLEETTAIVEASGILNQ